MFGRRASLGTRVQYYAARVPSDTSDSERCYAIRKDQLEPLVMSRIVELLDTPNMHRRLEKEISRQMKATANKTRDTKSLRQRVADLEKNIAKGVERLLLLDGEDLADASRLLANWRQQRRTLEEQLQASEDKRGASPQREAARVAAELADLRKTFAVTDPTTLRADSCDRDRRHHALLDRWRTTQIPVSTGHDTLRWHLAPTREL